jgi:hypothetical protein
VRSLLQEMMLVRCGRMSATATFVMPRDIQACFGLHCDEAITAAYVPSCRVALARARKRQKADQRGPFSARDSVIRTGGLGHQDLAANASRGAHGGDVSYPQY